MIDRKTIDEIYSKADIVEVVSEFVSLHKAGVNYKGLCPFHNEKTPSFVVSPSKGICHCFSCGKGGNVVHFLMEHEQMTFPEALKWLANKYGIRIEEKELTAEEIEENGRRESLFIVNQWANQYFQDNLYNTQEGQTYGLGYLRGRGLRDDIIKKFELGYCLQQSDALCSTALKQGYQEDYLIKTGLCNKRDNGTLYDKYHGRVIYPVHSLSGKVVAFGGRTLSNDKKIAKYINSPESEIYHKSYELYGIHQAKKAITQQDRCYLVEGYMDVISMHQSGIENVVASSGTSLTEGQIRMLHRFTNNITILYDGDSAGIHASLRGINMLLAEGMNIKVLLLPDGDDPDSFARKHNAEEYQEYIKSHQEDFITFKVRILSEDAKDDLQKRSEVVNVIVDSIALIPDAITRSIYLQECSRQLNVKEEVLIRQTARKRKQNYDDKAKANEQRKTLEETDVQTQDEAKPEVTENNTPIAQQTFSSASQKIEYTLMKLIIRYGESKIAEVEVEGNKINISLIDYVSAEFLNDKLSFSDPLYQQIWLDAVKHCHDEGFKASTFFMSSPNLEISKLAVDMMSNNYQLSEWYTKDKIVTPTSQKLATIVPSLIMRLKLGIIIDRSNDVYKQLQQLDYNSNEYKKMMETYICLINTKKKLAKQCGETNITL